MALWVIELNDIGVRVTRDGELVDLSPGVAIVDRKQVLTGVQAASQQHLNPRAVYNRYWQQLSEQPLPGATRQCRHHADLAYHHLQAIIARCGQPSEVIFAVPAHYGETELALLLGICAALKLDVAGLVDSNIACVSASAPAGRYTVAEIYQHHVTLVDVEVNADTGVTRGAVEVVDQSGLSRIYAACIDLIADAFLEQARFDPLHEATTEQLLYTNLPAWLERVGTSAELDVAIDYHGSRFSSRVSNREFERVTNMVLAPIKEFGRHDTAMLLSPELAALPGSAALLSPAQILSSEDCAAGIAEHRLSIHADGASVAFITRLPTARAPRLAATEAAQPSTEASAATHILCGSRAVPVSANAVYLRVDGSFGHTPDDRAAAEVRLESGAPMLRANGPSVEVNHTPVTDVHPLKPGDVIVVEQCPVTFTAISVTNSSAI